MSLLESAIDAATRDAEYAQHRDACAAARRDGNRIAAGVHADRMRRAFERILARLMRPEPVQKTEAN